LSKIYKVAVIGAGKMATNHLDVFKSFKQINLVSLYSKRIENATKVAKKYSIPKATSNLEEIFNEKIHGVLICVTAKAMFSIIKKVIKYKIPLLLEKPVGLSFQEAKELSILYKKYNTPNLIGLNRRYYSTFQYAYKYIKKKDYRGFLIEGHECSWRLKDLVRKDILNKWLFANSIHTINLIKFFGISRALSSKIITSNTNLDVNISAVLQFENKIIGTYISNWMSTERWSIKLFFKEYVIIFKPLEEAYFKYKNSKIKKIKLSKEDTKFKPGLYLQTKNFIKLMKNKKNSWPDENLTTILDTYNIINKMS
jgi:predicted dehydrogenase